jgi:integrase
VARFQNGSPKRVMRAQGETWVLRYRTRRMTDGKWVEGTPIFIGYTEELRSEEAAWRKVESLNINLNQPRATTAGPVTFGELAKNYLANELPEDQSDSTAPKDRTTAITYRRYLNRWILPRWEQEIALAIEPLDVEGWLKALGKKHKLENPTRVKIRDIMNLIYRHGIRYKLLPRDEDSNPIKWVRQSGKSNFEPIILTLPQVFDILENLDLRVRTMVLVDAATGLRVSEIIALFWSDVDWEKQCIYVRRKYVYGEYGDPKSRASKAPVPLHPILAAHLQIWRSETPYAKRPTSSSLRFA